MKFIKIISTFVFLQFVLIQTSNAQIPNVNQTTVYKGAEAELQVLFELLLREDPALKQIKSETQMIASKIDVADVLPNPELGVDWSPQPMQKALNQTLAIRAMQMIPWPGTIQASVDVQKAVLEQQKWMELARETERLLGFQKAWYEWYRIKKQALLIDEQINWIKAEEADLLTKLSTGMSQSARIELSIEHLKMQQEKVEFEQKIYSAQQNLAQYVSNPIDWILPETLKSQSSKSFAFSDKHPLIYALDSKQKANRYRHVVAKKEGLPMIGLGAEYMFIDERFAIMAPEMQMQPAVTVMATITLPIYRKKYNAMQKETKSAQSETQFEEERMILELKSMFESLIREREIKQKELDLYGNELPQKWSELESLARERWQTGAGSYAEIIRIQREKIDLKRMALNALVELKNVEAELAWNQPFNELN